jgi:hypothetical protein
MDKKTRGAWIVHHTNKLQNVSDQSDFDNIFVAGKCGILLSAISATEESTISKERMRTLAKAASINALELPRLLQILETEGLLQQSAEEIRVLGVTTPAVLQHVSTVFEHSEPTSEESAAIELAERASLAPCERTAISGELSDDFHLANNQMTSLLHLCETIGFTDYQDVDSTLRLYFNSNIFRRDSAKKVKAVLDSLTQVEQLDLLALDEQLRKTACVSADEAQKILGDDLFHRAISVGLLDVSRVSNNKEEIAYVSRPQAYSKFGNSLVEDALDLAKAFVSSLTYGMTRSSHERGQIRMLCQLMQRLIQGEWVGPVDAIGQDYKVLELKGVVEVKRFAKQNWRGHMRSGPNMRLLKREVGELALRAIQEGDVSSETLPAFPGATVTRFLGPESQREEVRRRQHLGPDKKKIDKMLMSLREGDRSK